MQRLSKIMPSNFPDHFHPLDPVACQDSFYLVLYQILWRESEQGNATRCTISFLVASMMLSSDKSPNRDLVVLPSHMFWMVTPIHAPHAPDYP